MKRYAIRATSTYTYQQTAGRGHHATRLLPADGGEQKVEASTLNVAPHSGQITSQFDFFGNHVNRFSIDSDHDTLTLAMEAQVQVARHPTFLISALSWEEVAQNARAQASLRGDSPAHYLRKTPVTTATMPLRLYGTQMFSPGRPIMETAFAMSAGIFETLRYDPQATDVTTKASEAFDRGAGVCQDFAHIMIALCRSSGIPARYVSGYIRTLPPPGENKLEGADAMHAWVSVWTGAQTGWVDYDPTNGILVGDDHITVAVGRDYTDTAPVRGEVVGGGAQSHKVAVDVELIG